MFYLFKLIFMFFGRQLLNALVLQQSCFGDITLLRPPWASCAKLMTSLVVLVK